MTHSFAEAAGPRPERNFSGLWRQAVLQAVAVAVAGDAEARLGLARSLLALDHPADAALVLDALDGPEVSWLRVVALGQSGDLASARAEARAISADGDSPPGRDFARRVDDLCGELDAVAGIENGARFDVIAHGYDPRRVLLQGRSSATVLADPGAGALRLGPYSGLGAGNRAVFSLVEAVARIGDGAPTGGPLPGDQPPAMRPQVMLDALVEVGRERTDELSRLARDVRDEREELSRRSQELDDELARLIAERARLRRVPTPGALASSAEPAYLPRTASEAAALLGVGPTSTRAEVDRAYRDLVRGAHPDRVAGLHPGLRQEAESLTVALNAARDLLLQGR